jgi:hypothetical protein
MMEITTKCCNEEMEKNSNYFNGDETMCFVCANCGHSISIIDSQLDEEELRQYQ